MELEQVKDNTWVLKSWELIPVYRLDAHKCILLDTGLVEQREELQEALTNYGLEPVGVICSHAHIDHMGNVAYLKEKYGAKLAMSLGEAGHQMSYLGLNVTSYLLPPEDLESWDAVKGTPCLADRIILPTEDHITFCGAEFDIVHTPGHTVDHICTRMRIPRKVVVGYWKSEEAQKQIATWARVAAGVADAHNVRCLMFGMNMNNVAVTDGDRVEFEQRMGYHVDYYPVSSLMEYFKKVTDAEADALVEEYKKEYTIKIDESGEEVYWEKVKNAAKAEIALRRVLKDENAVAYTTNFDDLGDADIDDPNFCGFDQIPGLASQRLMAEGYGFGAEGDWKTACLFRTLWVMNQGLEKGCSFLEDYTLNFAADRTSSLQSHMLEVCPLIATDKPKLEVHFLGIGIRKQQTARLVFTSKTGKGVKATVVDLGNRFRLIASEVECIEPKAMPKLPVASALWVPQPTFEIGAGAWILAGGTHHSAFSYDITAEYWEDFCEILGIEFVNIDKNTTISSFKQQLRNNEIYYMLNKALR